MPDIEITDVPDETLAILQRRAAQAHQSLEENLVAWLNREAATVVIVDDVEKLSRKAADLASPEVMADAWDRRVDRQSQE